MPPGCPADDLIVSLAQSGHLVSPDAVDNNDQDQRSRSHGAAASTIPVTRGPIIEEVNEQRFFCLGC